MFCFVVVVVDVGCLTSQQHASVSPERICSDNCTCCHTEIEVADPTLYLTQTRYTDTRPTRPSADPITQGAWQGSHWSAKLQVPAVTPAGNRSTARAGIKLGPFAHDADGSPPGQPGDQVVVTRLGWLMLPSWWPSGSGPASSAGDTGFIPALPDRVVPGTPHRVLQRLP